MPTNQKIIAADLLLLVTKKQWHTESTDSKKAKNILGFKLKKL